MPEISQEDKKEFTRRVVELVEQSIEEHETLLDGLPVEVADWFYNLISVTEESHEFWLQEQNDAKHLYQLMIDIVERRKKIVLVNYNEDIVTIRTANTCTK